MNGVPRIGVVGTGSLGYHHARLLRECGAASLAGFYEISADRAQTVSRELGIRAYASLESLLQDVDAVSIVVPTPAHHVVAKQALNAGKHLLIEKPITTTLDEADELVALAAARGVLLQIGHIERFNRAIRAALPHVDHPLFIDSDRLAPFNPRGADVAVVLDLMIHDIDLLLTLTGAAVQDVAAVGIPVLTPSIDIANARITFATGAVATITASRVSRDRMRKLRIFQRNGYLSLDLAAGTGEMYRLRSDVDLGQLARTAQPLEAFVERVMLDAPEGEPLRLELESFIAALTGEGPVAVSGRDGRDALAVALRIVREIERSLPAIADIRRSRPADAPTGA
jgi:predicted dehydrogenase